MKAEKFVLVNGIVRNNALKKISCAPLDGSFTLTISSTGDKSSRQRGLQWLWYRDVVLSGVGGNDEADSTRLHLVSKYRWCLPILVRDDDQFAELWLDYFNKWRNPNKEAHKDRFEWFVDNHVSTERLNQSQMAEYLTAFKDHYCIELGVNLTDPAAKGWEDLLKRDEI